MARAPFDARAKVQSHPSLRAGTRVRRPPLVCPGAADHCVDRPRRDAILSGDLYEGLAIALPLEDTTNHGIGQVPLPTCCAEHGGFSVAQAACLRSRERAPQRSGQRSLDRRFGRRAHLRSSLTARTACDPRRARASPTLPDSKCDSRRSAREARLPGGCRGRGRPHRSPRAPNCLISSRRSRRLRSRSSGDGDL